MGSGLRFGSFRVCGRLNRAAAASRGRQGREVAQEGQCRVLLGGEVLPPCPAHSISRHIQVTGDKVRQVAFRNLVMAMQNGALAADHPDIVDVAAPNAS